jgi:hypothetical protein
VQHSSSFSSRSTVEWQQDAVPVWRARPRRSDEDAPDGVERRDRSCLPDGKTEKNKTEPRQPPNNQSPMKGPACLAVVGAPFCFSRSSHRGAASIETMSGSELGRRSRCRRGAGVGRGLRPTSRDSYGPPKFKKTFLSGVWEARSTRPAADIAWSLQPGSLEPAAWEPAAWSLGACSLEPGRADF